MPSCLPPTPLQVLEEVSPVVAAEGVIPPEGLGSSGIEKAKGVVARCVLGRGSAGRGVWAGGHYAFAEKCVLIQSR